LDSIVGVELVTILNGELGFSVSIEFVTQGPTIQALVEELLQLFLGQHNIEPEKNESATVEFGYSMQPSLWFAGCQIVKTASFHLFCLPYGGAGASVYQHWQSKMPADIAVVPIQLPGREGRIKEKLFDNINELVEILEKVLQEELSIPYAFYGHSAGALIAFRLACKLQNNPIYGKNLKHLLVGGCSAPQCMPNPLYQKILGKLHSIEWYGLPKIDNLKSYSYQELETLFKIIMETAGVQSSNIQNKDFIKTFVPLLIADLSIVGTYVNRKEDMLNIPITVFHGRYDDKVNEDEIKLWQRSTTGIFTFHLLDGDHFFLHGDQTQEQLINIIHGVLVIS